MSSHVFISHSSKDAKVTGKIVSYLEKKGHTCWIAPRDVKPGVSYAESIIDGLNKSDKFLLIYTANSNESVQVQKEVDRAVNQKTPILALKLDDAIPTKAMEYYLCDIHWLVVENKKITKEKVQELEKALRSLKPSQDTTRTHVGLGKKKESSFLKPFMIALLPLFILAIGVVIGSYSDPGAQILRQLTGPKQRILSENKLKLQSIEELNLIKWEIHARRGWTFHENPEFEKYFANSWWYRPYKLEHGQEDEIHRIMDQTFSEFDHENMAIIDRLVRNKYRKRILKDPRAPAKGVKIAIVAHTISEENLYEAERDPSERENLKASISFDSATQIEDFFLIKKKVWAKNLYDIEEEFNSPLKMKKMLNNLKPRWKVFVRAGEMEDREVLIKAPGGMLHRFREEFQHGKSYWKFRFEETNWGDEFHFELHLGKLEESKEWPFISPPEVFEDFISFYSSVLSELIIEESTRRPAQHNRPKHRPRAGHRPWPPEHRSGPEHRQRQDPQHRDN